MRKLEGMRRLASARGLVNNAGVDWSARRQGERSGRRLAAAPDRMTHVLGRMVVKHTARSLTVFTAVDSCRSWRL